MSATGRDHCDSGMSACYTIHTATRDRSIISWEVSQQVSYHVRSVYTAIMLTLLHLPTEMYFLFGNCCVMCECLLFILHLYLSIFSCHYKRRFCLRAFINVSEWEMCRGFDRNSGTARCLYGKHIRREGSDNQLDSVTQRLVRQLHRSLLCSVTKRPSCMQRM